MLRGCNIMQATTTQPQNFNAMRLFKYYAPMLIPLATYLLYAQVYGFNAMGWGEDAKIAYLVLQIPSAAILLISLSMDVHKALKNQAGI